MISFVVSFSGEYIAGTAGDGILTSRNGIYWERKNEGLEEAAKRVSALTITKSGSLLAGLQYGRTYRSTDRGLLWSVVDTMLGSRGFFVLKDSSIISLSGLGRYLSKSTDDGATWSVFATCEEMGKKLRYNDTAIFVLQEDLSLSRSIDGGASWMVLNPLNTRFSDFTITPKGMIVAVTGDDQRIFSSTDNGVSWSITYFENAISDDLVLDKVGSTPNGYLFLNGYPFGIFRSTDNGSSWTHNGFKVNTVYALAVNSLGHVFCGTENNGVFYSSNRGLTWRQTNSLYKFSSSVLTLLVNSSGDVFAGTEGDGIYYTYNNGYEWYPLNYQLQHHKVHSLAINPNDDLFAGTNNGRVYRLLKNEFQWEETIPGDTTNNIIALGIDDDGSLYAASRQSVFTSTNNGETWSELSTSDQFTSIRSLLVDAHNHLFVGTADGVYRTTDKGRTWSQRLSGRELYSLTMNSQGHIFAGTDYYGVDETVDDGNSWGHVGSGLPESNVYSLVVDRSGFMYAGLLDFGVFRTTASTITSVGEPPFELPVSFSLSQNYPNPFNPSTVISYQLPVKSYVTLKVYNVLGQEVRTLVDEMQDAGYKSATFEEERLPSGVYFYRMTAVGQDGILSYTGVKKVLLLK